MALRARWAEVQNQALVRAGFDTRVDHRSLEAQGIDREAMQHRGPAVSRIEARGKKAQVSVRREAERAMRARALEPERRAVEAEVRVVTRQEMAAEKVAARERRELAAEVTGPERESVLPLVEADRREQLGRAQAAAERRVERRQGLSIGGELKEKLLTQARALRERIGREIGRVKEWVRGRFPAPLERLKERSRDLFDTVARRGRGARGPERGKATSGDADHSQEPGRRQTPTPAGQSPDAAERARVLKEATTLGRQELARQVQEVRENQAARQRLDELVRQERERQRAQQVELERQRELERVKKLEQERAIKRSRGRGRGLGD